MSKTAEKQEPAIDEFDMQAFVELVEGDQHPISIDLRAHSDVTVKKATATQLYNILDFIRVGLEALEIKDFSQSSLQTFAKGIQENPTILLNALIKDYDRGMLVVEGLCSLDAKEVMDLEIDDLMLLIACEWKVNEDFFTKRVMKNVSLLIPVNATAQ